MATPLLKRGASIRSWGAGGAALSILACCALAACTERSPSRAPTVAIPGVPPEPPRAEPAEADVRYVPPKCCVLRYALFWENEEPLAEQAFTVLIEQGVLRTGITEASGKLLVPEVPAGDHCVEIAGYYFHLSALNKTSLREPIYRFIVSTLSQKAYTDTARTDPAEFQRRCTEGFERGR